jgi:signal transduction histidine kinase
MFGNSLPVFFTSAWNRLARPRLVRADVESLGTAPLGSAGKGTGSAVPPRTPSATDDVAYPGIGTLFLVWSVIAVLTSARNLFQPTRPAPFSFELALVYIACFAPWALFTPVAFRLEARFPLGRGGWLKNLTYLALCSVPLCLVAGPLMPATAGVAWFVLGRAAWRTPTLLAWLRDFPVAQLCFWSSVAGGYFIRTLYQLRAQERHAAELALEKSRLEAGLNQAQLDVLRAKLNPHFLFNSLQNISVLTGQDPETASRMLTRLGELLRAVLRRDSSPESTLREEIELTGSYVALEQLRFGERLRVEFDIAPDVQSSLVPCFILQPLIENAVVHGLRGVKKTGVITVSAARAGNEVVLRVTDNGVGLRSGQSGDLRVGVGLGSTCERLERMYPGRHTFAIRQPDSGGTEVRITLPLRFEDGADQAGADE